MTGLKQFMHLPSGSQQAKDVDMITEEEAVKDSEKAKLRAFNRSSVKCSSAHFSLATAVQTHPTAKAPSSVI